MGNLQIKLPKTKASRQAADKQRQAATQNVKSRIQDLENQICSQAVTTQGVVQALSVAEAAKTQLDRDGGALTKTDLIAIVMALQPGLRIDEMGNNTVKDLNAVIRTIVYDPARYFPQQQQQQIQNVNKYPAIVNQPNQQIQQQPKYLAINN